MAVRIVKEGDGSLHKSVYIHIYVYTQIYICILFRLLAAGICLLALVERGAGLRQQFRLPAAVVPVRNLGGSWVVIRGVLSRPTLLVTSAMVQN